MWNFCIRRTITTRPEADGGIRWNDPELGIDWGVTDPVLSEKDTKSPFLKDAVTGFEDW